MSFEDEFGKQYEFESLYHAYSNLGEPESTAFDKVLKDAGFMGFEELCDRARMLCYDLDSEYWEAYRPWAKATKKSISKPAPKFSDMVQKQRSKNGGIAKYDGDMSFITSKLNEALIPLIDAENAWNDYTPGGQHVLSLISEAVDSVKEVLNKI